MFCSENDITNEEATQGLWMVKGRPCVAWVDCDLCSPNTRLDSWLYTMIHKVPPRSNPLLVLSHKVLVPWLLTEFPPPISQPFPHHPIPDLYNPSGLSMWHAGSLPFQACFSGSMCHPEKGWACLSVWAPESSLLTMGPDSDKAKGKVWAFWSVVDYSDIFYFVFN